MFKLTGYGVVTAALGVRSVLLSGLMIILARSLGSNSYGALATAISIGAFLSTFSGLGAGPLHVRQVALAELPFDASLSYMLRRVLISTLPLLSLTCIAIWAFIPPTLPLGALILLALGEYLGAAASDMWMRSMQSREQFGNMGITICAVPAAKMLLALGVLFAGALSLEVWAWSSCVLGAAAFSALSIAVSQRSRESSTISKIAGSSRFGAIGFAIASASSRIHGDADKVILTRLVSPDITGRYTVAYRLADVLTLPIVAGAEKLLPKLFKIGILSEVSRNESFRLALVGLGMGLVLSAAGYLAAPLLPFAFGDEFSGSIRIARALCLVPLSMAIWVVVRSYAGTTGFERSMGSVELMGALFNILLTLVLVLRFGWMGAVIATYTTHIFMTASLATWIAYKKVPGQPSPAKS